MHKICVFGGTTEGRKLIEFLSAQPVSVTACVATEYGEELLEPAENTVVSARRLPKADIEEMLRASRFDLVVDATHPYAVSITQSVYSACEETSTDYLRLLREEGDLPDDAVFAENTEQAVKYLNCVSGNILLTTGSKELAAYSGINGFADRAFARVLPMRDSLTACQDAGVKPAHIIAMQGPFSTEMNLAILKQTNARYLVTKSSGTAGGFQEKAAAARQLGTKLIVIGRPPQKDGMNFNQVIRVMCEKFQLTSKTKIAVVGIGPGSCGAMTQDVSAAIQSADCLVGAKRMIDAAAHTGQNVFYAISPEKIAAFVDEHPEYQKIAVVMSGDVGFFSGAKKLLPLLSGHRVRILPGLNSMAYLCSKLGKSYEDVVPISLHGREHNIIGEIRRNPRVFVLVGGENGMKALCADLAGAGLGQVRMCIGERLSYPDEKISVGLAEELCAGTFDPLSAALIENDRAAAIVTHGLPDALFLRSGSEKAVVPMTKSEIRSVSLSKLQLTVDAVCWDIGAGTGSVSIEMALQAVRGHVYAVEQKENAADLLQSNMAKFGVNNLSVIVGTAPESCKELPKPTHVFIGGSNGNMRGILSAILEKNPNARIVATAVSLESVAELTSCIRDFPFDLQEAVLVSAARSREAGTHHLMFGQNPVYIFTMQNTGGSL